MCASGVVPRRSRTGASSSPCLNDIWHRRRTHDRDRPIRSRPAARRTFPALELDVLDYWDDDDTFRASIARRDGAPEYVFYDGPPFANGLPHYGHLLTGYVKDIVPRYRTMRGYKVERRFGWDTHGLPAELEVQRQLGITDKAQIEEMGIEKFNDACRASVLKYTDEWRAYVTRQARWVDFDNDYKTLDLGFMESVIWAFKQLWDKGLAYEGYRVLPYCWNDETPLSSHELRMDDDVYQSRQDPAITVGFRVDRAARCWMALPADLDDDAVDAAVQPGGRGQPRRRRTCVVQAGDRRYVLAKARLAAYARELGEEPEILATYSGRRAARRCATCRRSRISWTRPTLFRCCAATSSPPRTAPGSCTWRRPTARTTRRPPTAGGHRRRSRRWTPRAASTRRCPTTPGQHVFDANPQIIRDLKNGTGPRPRQRPGADAARDLRALLPALLALPKPVDLPGGVVVVRQGHRVPRPDGRAQPADHLVSRARQGRPVRQVAVQAPGTGRSRETATGARRFRCGSPTTRPIRGSTSTAASTSSSATSGCGRTTCTGPTSTS